MNVALATMFLVLHGLLHLGVWTAPTPEPGTRVPFDPTSSRLLAAAHVPDTVARRTARALAVLTTVLFCAAGSTVATGNTAWPALALAAVVCGLLLKAVWFDIWLTVGILIDAGIVVALARSWPSPLY
ncbi:hypothetical protein ACWGJ2_35775 [Streptomyces sp. NPDC054796]